MDSYINYKQVEQTIIHSRCEDIDHYRDLYDKLNNIYKNLGNVQRYVHKTPNEVMAHHLYDMVWYYDNKEECINDIIDNIIVYYNEYKNYISKQELDKIIEVCEVIKCDKLLYFFKNEITIMVG